MKTASFYKDLEFSNNNIIISSMLTSDFGKEIRIAFKEGQVMKEHQTKFPITVMTMQGCIEFRVDSEIFILNEGDVIALEGNIIHELKALKESVVRLSLNKGDTAERVKEVVEL